MSSIEVEFPCARMKVLVPKAVADTLHSGERYLSILYRSAICMELLCTKSYRKGCRSFNYHRHRIGDQALTVSSFSRDIIREGVGLIRVKRNACFAILESFGFDGKTGKYKGECLPDHLCTKEHTYTEVGPDEHLSAMTDGRWNPENPEIPDAPVNEELEKKAQKQYFQPDTKEADCPRKGKQRRERGRTPKAPDKIPSTCESYVKWRNTHYDNELGRILHFWRLETNPLEVIYIMIDAVYVKEQAGTHRRKDGEKAEEKGKAADDAEKRITHWNIKVEWDNDRSYIITDENLDNAFLQLLAFLLKNGFITRFFVFLVDGEDCIFKGIERYFKGNWDYTIYLDYAHIEKKIYDMLSLGIVARRVPDPRGEKILYQRGDKKGQIKKQAMTSLSVLYARAIVTAIWTGNVAEAIAALSNIDPDDIDKQYAIDKLMGYLSLNGKGQYITCYALRRIVGLRNSSNGVEGVNELIVALDQKGSNKTYRSDGSHAATALTAADKNHELNPYIETGAFTFEYIEA